MQRALNGLLVAVFLAMLSAPLAINLTGGDGGDADAENRTLAPWPTHTSGWAGTTQWIAGAAGWFDDHFGLRSDMIRWYGVSRYVGLGVSPTPLVLLGRDGWLFYREDGGFEDAVNATPLSEAELGEWRTMIAKAQTWCRAHGIEYLFTVAPDKHVLYPEHFPDTLRPLSALSRTDQVITAATDTGAVLDLRQVLREAAPKERLFHVTDTHWNDRGAFLAYQQIINTLHARVPAVPPARDRSSYVEATRTLSGRDLAAFMGLRALLHEDDLRLLPVGGSRGYVVRTPDGGYATGGDPLIVTEIPGSSLPRAVIFRDSFTSALAPFLSEHFSRAVYLWQNDFDADVVLRERPDVVIHEIVGRHLHNIYAYPQLIPDP